MAPLHFLTIRYLIRISSTSIVFALIDKRVNAVHLLCVAGTEGTQPTPQ
jgi:hypothetical protein